MSIEFLRAKAPLGTVRELVALLCTLLLVAGDPAIYAQTPAPQQPGQTAAGAAAAAEADAPKLLPDQLDSLVAPIALYPDPLLAQMLAASTYPLEIVQLQQWLAKHKDLKDKALADAVKKEPWDAAVQSMAPIPDAVKQLAENIKWTTDLGNAFLSQQGDVMDAVQRMRGKAKGAGQLESNKQQKVETKVIENKTVVVIQPSDPQVVYVPSYNPTVVYGAAPYYPYPPIVYPPVGYYAAGAAISFGVGMAVGAAMSGGWGYGCGWGGGGNNTININNNNNFVNNSNRQNVNGGNRNNVNSGNRGGNSSWQHNPSHRGGTPYSNKSTAGKYGGQTAGNRQQGASNRSGSGAGSGSRGNSPSTADRGGSGSRGNSPSASNRSSGGGGGGDKVGNRSVSPSSSSSSRGSSGGGFSGGSGSSARSSSSRGSSSMSSGSRGGGGGSRGGGGGRRR